MLQGGIRGTRVIRRISRIMVIRGLRGIRVIRRIRGIEKSQFVHQYRHQTGRRQSSIRKAKAQRENPKKESTEGGAPRGDTGGKGDKGDKGNKGIGDRPRL